MLDWEWELFGGIVLCFPLGLVVSSLVSNICSDQSLLLRGVHSFPSWAAFLIGFGAVIGGWIIYIWLKLNELKAADDKNTPISK